MRQQARIMAVTRDKVIRRLFPLLLASTLLLLAVGCSAGRSESAGSNGQTGDEQTITVEKNGVTVTLSPRRGAINSGVQVDVTGVKAVEGAPFANVSFRDSSGSGGEDSLTTDYTLDTRKTREDGSLRILYRVPANVLIKTSPDAQNPTSKAPTSLGAAYIVFAWAAGEIEVPFGVIEPEAGKQLPLRGPVDLDVSTPCVIESGPDGGSEGMQTWVVRCEDARHLLPATEAGAVMEKALAAGGWEVCGAAAGTTYYRKGDRVTTLAFAENDERNPDFGKVYLGQAPRGAECP